MVYLRKAVEDDMDLLYKWANDPIVRSNSFNTEPIPYEDHVNWFNKMIQNPSVHQFILMDEDIPIGQIRLNINEDEAEIGYSIESEFRRKGYGHKILQLIADMIEADYPYINTLVAKVKPDNIASNKLFILEGYEMEYSCYIYKFERDTMN